MTEVSQAIKELEEVQLPEGVHGRIMRHLLFLKFRTPFVVVMALLIVNLAVSGWRLWSGLTELEAPTLLSLTWTDIELSVSGLREALVSSYDIIPVLPALMFLLNAVLIAYIGLYLPRIFNKKFQRS